MNYSISELSKLAGVSSRTLRYYETIGLLSSTRNPENYYRVYGQNEVKRLQQILFYRELGVPLAKIKSILNSPSFDHESALLEHLEQLKARQEQLVGLIHTVEKSLKAEKGVIVMSDREKFEGFKKKLIEENEAKYGRETRDRYGDEIVDQSNQKLQDASEKDFNDIESLNKAFNDKLKEAMADGDPAAAPAQEACDLHRRWLAFYWPAYHKEAHLGLAQTYVSDERFKAYYEAIAPGAAEFLYAALQIYCA